MEKEGHESSPEAEYVKGCSVDEKKIRLVRTSLFVAPSLSISVK